jgi:pimeloyl-ACP methyl ester carboxylesterase
VIPETRFARTSDGYLAYQALGKGRRDIVFMFPGPSHLEFLWEIPEHARALRRLAELGRVIVFDMRGVGMSERTTYPVSLEQRADDIVAVMAAAGSRRAVLRAGRVRHARAAGRAAGHHLRRRAGAGRWPAGCRRAGMLVIADRGFSASSCGRSTWSPARRCCGGFRPPSEACQVLVYGVAPSG